jgi:hypothetical protein
MAARTALAFGLALMVGTGWSSFIDGLKDARPELKATASLVGKLSSVRHHLVTRFDQLWSPHDAAGWLGLLGPFIFALLIGLATAALLVARRGVRRS